MRDPGGIFEHIQRGEKFRIRAETYNALMDMAAEWHAARRSNTPRAPVQPAGREDAVYVLVKNTTGSAAGQFSVLGLGAPLVLPSASEQTFRERHIYTGITPAAGAPFVITQVPIADGAIGVAVIAGETAVKLTVGNASDTRAAPTADPTQLTTGSLGPARILWKDAGTGSSIWARVLLTGDDDDDAPCCCGPVAPAGGGGSGGGGIMLSGGGSGGGTGGGGTIFPTDGGGAGVGPGGCKPGQVYYAGVGCVNGCPGGTFYDAGSQTCQPIPNYNGPGGTGGPGWSAANALSRMQGDRVAFQGGTWTFPQEVVAGASLTTGDVLYYDSASPEGFTILSLGGAPDGYVLTLAGGKPSWAAGGGGGSTPSIKTSTDLTGQTGASVTAVTFTVGGADAVVTVPGLYLFLSAAAFATMAVTLNWTDPDGTARSRGLTPLDGLSLSPASGGAYYFADSTVRAKASTAVSVVVSRSGGTSTFDTSGRIVQI